MSIMTDSPIRFPGLFRRLGVYRVLRGLPHRRQGHLLVRHPHCTGSAGGAGLLHEAEGEVRHQRGRPHGRCAVGRAAGHRGRAAVLCAVLSGQIQKEDGSFDWAESVAIWDGGLAIYGGVIAAVLVCLVLSKKRGFKLGALTDLVVMGLLIGQAIGRWGNFMNREAFGAETTLPWRMQLTTTGRWWRCILRSCTRACGT